MPHKTCTTKGATYRLDRRFPGVGRIAVASGATTRDGFRKRNALLTRLWDKARLDVLRAIKAGTITITEVMDADRRDDLDGLFRGIDPLELPLWETAETWYTGSAKPQRRRAQTAFQAMKAATILPETATVGDLAAVDWDARSQEWDGSPSNWNHWRKAISKFLTDTLGDKWHPFRRRLMDHYPPKVEPPRVPDISVDLFWKIVHAAAEHVRPAFVVIAHMGLDVGEYLRLTKADLRPNTHSIATPGTKGRVDVMRVDPRMWDWAERAIPSPVRYKALRRHWKAALTAAEADTTLRLKDLRHCPGQWATDEGVPESKIQVALRHKDVKTTRIYTRQRDKGEVSRAVADAMLRSA
jgi:integrase